MCHVLCSLMVFDCQEIKGLLIYLLIFHSTSVLTLKTLGEVKFGLSQKAKTKGLD